MSPNGRRARIDVARLTTHIGAVLQRVDWRRLLPLSLVAGAIVFNLVVLRAETMPVNTLNDTGMHSQMVRWARGQIDQGRVPLDGWFPNLGLGSPHFHHYQSLPHTAAAYVSKAFGVERTFTWTMYLLLSLWPLSIYWSARIAGFSRWTSGTVALVSPLLASIPGHGFEHGSYLFRGYGMWAQLWGMWLLPLAWASSWRAVAGKGSRALGALAVGLTLACHFLTGYQALLAIGIWVLVKPSEFLRRLGRAAAVGVGGALISAWAIVPLIGDSAWANQSVYQRGTFFNDSFGAGEVLGWLVTGELFDAGRFPVVTILLAVGIGVCVTRFRRDERCRGALCIWVLAMLLFFGRPTLGPLVDLLPGSGDLLLHRFISGVHLAGLLLAGIGAAWLGGLIVRQFSRRLPRFQRLGPVAVAVAAMIVLVPAYNERAAHARVNTQQVRIQRLQDVTDGADLAVLTDRAKLLGGGRIYAGLRSNWGAQYLVGYVPVYSVLAFRDADQVGFTLRTAALSADIETLFDETNPRHYDLFNVRFLILPQDREPAVPAMFIARQGRHTLWRTETTGYMQVVDTTSPITADRTNLAAAMQGFLRSDLLARNLYPTVAFAGNAGALPTTLAGIPEGTAGRVDEQTALPDDGFFAGRVTANRSAVVLLKASYDPRWTVTVDGAEQQPQMIAPSYVGVGIGPGSHYVVFRYAAYPYYPFLFALGILALVGLVVGPKLLKRGTRSLLGGVAIAAIAAAWVASSWITTTSGSIPTNDGCGYDGAQYCAMARGDLARSPYSRRILPPAVVQATTSEETGEIVARFRQLNVVSLFIVAIGTVVLTQRVSKRLVVNGRRKTYGAVLSGSLIMLGAMGLHFSMFYPALTDHTALALGLLWFLAFTHERTRIRWASVPLAFLAIIAREAWILPIALCAAVIYLLRRNQENAVLGVGTGVAVLAGGWLVMTAPSTGEPWPFFEIVWLQLRSSLLTTGGIFNLGWMVTFALGFIPLMVFRRFRTLRSEFGRDTKASVPILVPALIVIVSHTVISLPNGADIPRLLFTVAPFVFAIAIAHVARSPEFDIELALAAVASVVIWRPFAVLSDSTDAYFGFFTPGYLLGDAQRERIFSDAALVALPLAVWVGLVWYRRRSRIRNGDDLFGGPDGTRGERSAEPPLPLPVPRAPVSAPKRRVRLGLFSALGIAAVVTAGVVASWTASTSGSLPENDGCGFDGVYYCAMARGQPGAGQYARRFLAPAIVRSTTDGDTRQIIDRFRQLNVLYLAVGALATGILARRIATRTGVSLRRASVAGVIAGSLVVLAPMGFHLLTWYPVLTDYLSLALGVLWFLAFTDDRTRVRWASVPLAVLAITAREAWGVAILAAAVLTLVVRGRDVVRLAAATGVAVAVGGILVFSAPSAGQTSIDGLREIWRMVRLTLLTPTGVFNVPWMLLFGVGFFPLLLLRRRGFIQALRSDRKAATPVLLPALAVIGAHALFAIAAGPDLPRLLFPAAPLIFSLAIAHAAKFPDLDRELVMCVLASVVLWRPFQIVPSSTFLGGIFFGPRYWVEDYQIDRIVSDLGLVALPLLGWLAVALYRSRMPAYPIAPGLELERARIGKGAYFFNPRRR